MNEDPYPVVLADDHDLYRNNLKLRTMDAGFRRNDDLAIFNCRVNKNLFSGDESIDPEPT
jgi:hypothetical protein